MQLFFLVNVLENVSACVSKDHYTFLFLRCRDITKEQLPQMTKRHSKQKMPDLHGQPKARDEQSKAEHLFAFGSTLKKWKLACRQAVTLMCFDSCTVFFMLSGTPPPLSAPVILHNWTSQQGWHTDDWTKRK